MKNSSIICAALLSTLATPTLASGFRFVDGEAVWAYAGIKSASNEAGGAKDTRIEFDRQTAVADGFRYVGGEAGWSYEVMSSKQPPDGTARVAATSPAAGAK